MRFYDIIKEVIIKKIKFSNAFIKIILDISIGE